MFSVGRKTWVDSDFETITYADSTPLVRYATQPNLSMVWVSVAGGNWLPISDVDAVEDALKEVKAVLLKLIDERVKERLNGPGKV